MRAKGSAGREAFRVAILRAAWGEFPGFSERPARKSASSRQPHRWHRPCSDCTDAAPPGAAGSVAAREEAP